MKYDVVGFDLGIRGRKELVVYCYGSEIWKKRDEGHAVGAWYDSEVKYAIS